MSKGQILEAMGEGFYRVRLDYSVEKIKTERDQIAEKVIEIDTLLPQKQVQELDAQSDVDDIISQINALIPDYSDDVEGARNQITELQKDLVKAGAALKKIELEVAELKANRLSAVKRIAQIDRIPESKEIAAWCADYTEDLSGTVGLVDINDEGGRGVIVHPGFAGEGVHKPQRDGELVPRAAQSGAQVYYNAAIMPGVQKWLPRYRIALITAIEGDTCDIALDAALSSAQNLDINKTDIYLAVPIQYMDCNAEAFEVGDRVLVRFFGGNPQVIGFESDPRPCALSGFTFTPSKPRNDGIRIDWGAPFFDGETEINPPLGTEFGSGPSWTAKPGIQAGNYATTKGRERLSGNRNWIGVNKSRDVLSWDGAPSRVFDEALEFSSAPRFPAWQSRWLSGPKVYYKLSVILDLTNEAVGGKNKVCGAAFNEAAGTRYLLAVCALSLATGPDYSLYRWPLDSGFKVAGPAEHLHTFSLPADSVSITGWYFNDLGTRAVCTLRNKAGLNNDPEIYSRIDKVALDIGSGFSVTTLWNQLDTKTESSNQTIYQYKMQALKEGTSGGCSSAKLGLYRSEIYDLDRSTSEQSVDQPIYVDYVGSGEVTTFYRRPAKSASSGYESQSDLTSKNYPHPCAGQTILNGGGETYPAEFQSQSVSEVWITSGRSGQAFSKDQIVTSAGTVIAESKHAPADSFNASYQSSSEFVNLSLECGNFTVDESSYSFTMSQGGVTGGIFAAGGLLAIDARFGFCALSERYFTQNESASLSGDSIYNYVELINQQEFIRVPLAVSESSETEYLSVWMNGALVESVVVEATTNPSRTDQLLRATDYILPRTTNIVLTVCDSSDSTTESNSVSNYPPPALRVNHSFRIWDAAGMSINDTSAVSVLYSHPGAGQHAVQKLDGTADAISYLFQRDKADNYSMHGLTVY